jgi:hypothetical protein
MSFWSKIIGGGVVTAVQGVANVVDQFVETPDEKRAWETVKAKMAQEPQLAQIEINKVEASHRSIFIAGWRPAIGWICAIAIAFNFIINPIIQWATCMTAAGCLAGPDMQIETMMELVLGMLGLAGLRTFEKYTGRAK